MRCVLPAETAKLTELQTASGRLLVLGLGIIPVLALTALKSNDFSHDSISPYPIRRDSEPTLRLPAVEPRRPEQISASDGGDP
jgi:hypothetical protein